MKRVVTLLRVSTDKQGSEEDIPVQRKECREYAAKQNWTIVEEIVEKVSGWYTPIDQREDLSRVRELASNGEMDILLVYYSDRIGRQTEMTTVITGLAERNVEVYSVREGKIGGTEHIDTLLTFMKFWSAEGESRKTSEKVTDAFKSYNEEGYYTGGPVPLGYKLYDTGEKINPKKSKTIKKIVINDEEVDLVKYIFNLALDNNWGGSRIAKHLNEHGYTNRGNIFRQNTITRMLRNPVYMGYKRYGMYVKVSGRSKKRTIAAKDEWKLQPFKEELQIISVEDFTRLQEIMDMRKTHDNDYGCNPYRSKGSDRALLPGLVRCHCGGNLAVNTSTKRPKRKDGTISEYVSVYYRCHRASNVKEHGKYRWGHKHIDEMVKFEVIQKMKSINFDEIEKEIEQFKQTQNVDASKELNQIEKMLKKKETALKNTENELEKLMMGESEFSSQQLSNLMSKINKDLDELRDKKSELIKTLGASEKIECDFLEFKRKYQNWVETFEASDFRDQQKQIIDVLDHVVLYEDNIKIKMKLDAPIAKGDGTNITGLNDSVATPNGSLNILSEDEITYGDVLAKISEQSNFKINVEIQK